MTTEEKKKLVSIARKLRVGDEKIPTDTVALIKYIDKRVKDSNKGIESRKERLNEILIVLLHISKLDFTKKAQVTDNNDFIDGIASGINMMGEELKETAVSLKEKETLLKEIHHRVKNNLQLVQSLLNIQMAYIEDETAIAKFKESIERVSSMALIHEKLYISSDLSKIDFKDYLNSLVSHLFVSYNINPDRIGIEVEINTPTLQMDLDYAIPCGLMINEMLTNCFKYAFPGDRKGKIKLTFNSRKKARGKRDNEIIIEDNGIGFPKNFKLREATTLGMQLILTLVEQLEAKIEIKKIHGAGLTVSFETND